MQENSSGTDTTARVGIKKPGSAPIRRNRRTQRESETRNVKRTDGQQEQTSLYNGLGATDGRASGGDGIPSKAIFPFPHSDRPLLHS